MITRVARLTAAELLKLRAHPFFWVSFALVVLGTIAIAWFFAGTAPTPWRADHTISIFATGAKAGLKLTTFVLLIFGAMLFAGEFDRGTIKILLTRPITRIDLFAAKSITALALALFLIATVFASALAVGCVRGELGPVWDDQSYNSNTSYEKLLGHTRAAIGMSIAAVVAAAFFGTLVSNLTESSGFAVAITLTVFLLADEILLRAFRDDTTRRWFFSVYPGYAFDVLRDFSRGSSTAWKEAYTRESVFMWVPLGTIAACMAAGFARFKFRNITA